MYDVDAYSKEQSVALVIVNRIAGIIGDPHSGNRRRIETCAQSLPGDRRPVIASEQTSSESASEPGRGYSSEFSTGPRAGIGVGRVGQTGAKPDG